MGCSGPNALTMSVPEISMNNIEKLESFINVYFNLPEVYLNLPYYSRKCQVILKGINYVFIDYCESLDSNFTKLIQIPISNDKLDDIINSSPVFEFYFKTNENSYSSKGEFILNLNREDLGRANLVHIPINMDSLKPKVKLIYNIGGMDILKSLEQGDLNPFISYHKSFEIDNISENDLYSIYPKTQNEKYIQVLNKVLNEALYDECKLNKITEFKDDLSRILKKYAENSYIYLDMELFLSEKLDFITSDFRKSVFAYAFDDFKGDKERFINENFVRFIELCSKGILENFNVNFALDFIKSDNFLNQYSKIENLKILSSFSKDGHQYLNLLFYHNSIRKLLFENKEFISEKENIIKHGHF